MVHAIGKRSPRRTIAKIVRNALRERFPDVSGRRNTRELTKIISSGADLTLRNHVLENPDQVGTDADPLVQDLRRHRPAQQRQHSRAMFPKPIAGSATSRLPGSIQLNAAGDIRSSFNTTFFTAGASSEPEQAGIWGAVVGTALTLVVTLILSFPIGVMSAVYLEEFAPKNRWTDLIEVNINNLAAVPSIVFGLLGLAVFLNFFGLPRSAPLVGGLCSHS